LNESDKPKAESYLTSEVKLAPEDADVLVSMASIFLSACKHTPSADRDCPHLDFATHCLLRAVDIDSSHAAAHYYLGLTGALRGDLDDAAEFFAHALDIDAQYVPALRDSAIVYLGMGKLQAAGERINKALLLSPAERDLKTLRRKVRQAQIARQLADLFGLSRH
jgi:tetratricopeptide (TPR) repeat protein